MPFWISVQQMDCRCDKNIGKELIEEEWHLHYLQCEDGRVGVEDMYYDCDPIGFVDDLLRLHRLGVRGTMVTLTQEGNWSKYEIADHGIDAYFAQIRYRDDPSATYQPDSN